MKKKLIKTNIILIILSLTALSIVSILISSYYSQKQLSENLQIFYKIYENQLKLNQTIDDLVVADAVKGDLRLTIVDKEGIILFDSSYTGIMGNHLERDEIKNARLGKPKSEVRYSETLNYKMMYYAEKLSLNGEDIVLRVATPLSKTGNLILSEILISILIVLILGGISVAVSKKNSKLLTTPFQEIHKQLLAIKNHSYKKKEIDSPKEVVSIFSDISDVADELNQKIEKINLEKDKSLAIISNIKESIILVDDNNIIIMANTCAKDLFNIPAEAIKKVKLDFVIDDKIFLEKLKASIENFDFWFNAKHYIIKISSVNFDKTLKMIIMFDNTEAEQLTKVKAEFFANASHELKTPITSIKGFNELLANDASLSARNKNFVEIIGNETNRLLEMINDMLTLSRLENNKRQICAENIDVGKMLYEIKNEFAPQLSEKNVTISIKGNAIINIDKLSLYEILNNIIGNGIKYNKPGGNIKISIDDIGNKFKIEIKDNGIGIAKEHLSKIFDRFYRVDDSRSRKMGGSGLGLAIVKHNALLNNVQVKIDSDVGAGTSFSLYFTKVSEINCN